MRTITPDTREVIIRASHKMDDFLLITEIKRAERYAVRYANWDIEGLSGKDLFEEKAEIFKTELLRRKGA